MAAQVALRRQQATEVRTRRPGARPAVVSGAVVGDGSRRGVLQTQPGLGP